MIGPHHSSNAHTYKAAFWLAYTAVALTVIEYIFSPSFFKANYPEWSGLQHGLYPNLWWAIGTFVLYLPVPMLVIRFVFRESLSEYGWSLRIKREHWLLYGAMLLGMAPIVVIAASLPSFTAVYPFYRGAREAQIAAVFAWEAAYLAQFLALEFFFRGVLAIGLGRSIGRLAVWVAMVPYCMIHYHKPMPEALASIVAGIVLGEIAQRSRSIAGGVLVHASVALTMDLLAMTRR